MGVPLGRNRPEKSFRPIKITHKLASKTCMSNYPFNKINNFSISDSFLLAGHPNWLKDWRVLMDLYMFWTGNIHNCLHR